MHTALLILLNKNEKNEPFSHVFVCFNFKNISREGKYKLLLFLFFVSKATVYWPFAFPVWKHKVIALLLPPVLQRPALCFVVQRSAAYLRHLKTSVTICEALSMFMRSGRGTRACVCVCVYRSLTAS